MLSLVEWYYSSPKERAQHDVVCFEKQILLPFTIGDIVETKHINATRGLTKTVKVIVVDINQFGFVATADIGHQIVWHKPDYGCLTYSLSRIGDLVQKCNLPIEDLLTDEWESRRILGRNLIRYNRFIEKFKRTKACMRWKLFLPKEKSDKERECIYAP